MIFLILAKNEAKSNFNFYHDRERVIRGEGSGEKQFEKVNPEWKVEGGKWRMEGGRWRFANRPPAEIRVSNLPKLIGNWMVEGGKWIFNLFSKIRDNCLFPLFKEGRRSRSLKI